MDPRSKVIQDASTGVVRGSSVVAIVDRFRWQRAVQILKEKIERSIFFRGYGHALRGQASGLRIRAQRT